MSDNETKKDCFIIKKKTVAIIAISIAVIAIILGLAIGIPLGIASMKLTGDPSTMVWRADAAFNEETDAITMWKDADKDFVVLNLTDVQMSENYTIFQNNRNYKLISELVDEVKPDLITLTGDNIWLSNTKAAAARFTKEMDKLGVPWAPVFGNHDAENDVDKNWLVEKFTESKHCLMRKGPVNIDGVGNYIINVKERGSNNIVHSIFMMDSLMYAPNVVVDSENIYDGATGVERLENGVAWDLKNGWLTKNGYTFRPIFNDDGTNMLNPRTNKQQYEVVGTGYDYVKQTQIDWYEWAVKGIQTINNNATVTSSVFMHIALPEFAHAYTTYKPTITNSDGSYKTPEELRALEDNNATNFGVNYEGVCAPKYNSGFFAKIKELNSTKNVVVGHDHVNSSSIMYDGVRLTYGLKTGDGCYWTKDGTQSGGTKLTLSSDGSTVTKHVYKNFK